MEDDVAFHTIVYNCVMVSTFFFYDSSADYQILSYYFNDNIEYLSM